MGGDVGETVPVVSDNSNDNGAEDQLGKLQQTGNGLKVACVEDNVRATWGGGRPGYCDCVWHLGLDSGMEEWNQINK